MVKDNIKNAELYYGLGDGIRTALEFFKGYTGAADQKEDITLDDTVMVKCRPYMTKPAGECTFEAHERCADVHFVVSGTECMGYAPVDTLSVTKTDEARDMIWLEGKGVPIPMQPGDFMITFPEDAHMPCIQNEAAALCCKMIAKVLL